MKGRIHTSVTPYKNNLAISQKNNLPFIEPKKEVYRICYAAFSKHSYNWLKNLTFHDINQSEIMLPVDGQ